MMRFDFIFGSYIPVESLFHRTDPRIKLIFTLYGMIVLFLVRHWLSFLVIGCVVCAMLYVSKIKYFTILKSLKSIWILFLLACIFPLFDATGKVFFNFGILTITDEALSNAFIIILRLGLLIGLSLLMTATTSPTRIADSTESLLKKMGVKQEYAHEISMIMSLAIRFIPIISMEANQIMKAQKARGAKFEDKNIINRMKAFFPVIIPLLVGSFKRADELALAMDVRYYHGFQGRTKYVKLQMKLSDYLLFVLILGSFTFALYLDKVIDFV
ncbi:MAG: energy-coupling factor transport system permease protein [Thermotogaceae bacterium]|jgi:energy-coupling factor transport system permease protein|nr:energy-coupling factor transport system permease protein [Thermotogaceae bacterium]